MNITSRLRTLLIATCFITPMAHADTVTITDLTDRKITLDRPAERLVILPVPWASTVIAFDGGTKKLIAMHPESKDAVEEGILGQFFPEAKNITSDIVAGGASRGFMPNVEAIAALKPDLVIQWGNRKDDGVTPLTNAGINTAVILYGSEDYARKIMTLVGTAMGRTEKLDMLLKWRDDTSAALAKGLEGLAEKDKPKVAYFFYTTPEFNTEGKGSYMDWQIVQSGGINAAAAIDGWGAVGIEQIASWNPDVILLGSFEKGLDVSRIYNDPILSSTNAAKSKKVYKVPVGGYRWDPPGQDSPLMWMWLANLLHPDRFNFDLRAATAEWYKKIYENEPTSAQIDEILNLKMNGTAVNYDQFAVK